MQHGWVSAHSIRGLSITRPRRGVFRFFGIGFVPLASGVRLIGLFERGKGERFTAEEYPRKSRAARLQS